MQKTLQLTFLFTEADMTGNLCEDTSTGVNYSQQKKMSTVIYFPVCLYLELQPYPMLTLTIKVKQYSVTNN